MSDEPYLNDDTGQEEGARRGCRPRWDMPATVAGISLYGLPWGFVGGALTMLWVPPNTDPSFFYVLDHSSEFLSYAIYYGLVIGLFGYLLRALGRQRTHLPLAVYFRGYLVGMLVGVLAIARVGSNVIGPETPYLSVLLSCCFIAAPVADALMLLFIFWRRL